MLIPILYEFVYPGTCFISQESVGVESFVLTRLILYYGLGSEMESSLYV